VAVESASQQLYGGDREAVGLKEQGDGRVEFDSIFSIGEL
jgi:hypothetical protein